MAWDTAVAINRTDKNNIVVSYGVLQNNITPRVGTPFRAVSFDGGKTWPAEFNGPLNAEALPTGNPASVGDNRGVAADKFGNFWYSATNRFDASGTQFNQPYFAISADGGITFQKVYEVPLPGVNNQTDYPQFCFGGDGQGNYGLHFQTTIFTLTDIIPTVGFIPITGLGTIGTPIYSVLVGLTNSIQEADLAASSDGRVWLQGYPTSFGAFSYIDPQVVTYKTPGPIDQNIAGPWDYIICNDITDQYGVTNVLAQPVRGFFPSVTSGILFDEQRQALYGMVVGQFPDYSQNMRIYFIVSRDNGQTWSDPIDIATTDFANRGYYSMALDEVTGNLLVGWYDGRNDPTFTSVEYFAAIIPARELDEIVCRQPLSIPYYVVPSLGVIVDDPLTTTHAKRIASYKKKLNHMRKKLASHS